MIRKEPTAELDSQFSSDAATPNHLGEAGPGRYHSAHHPAYEEVPSRCSRRLRHEEDGRAQQEVENGTELRVRTRDYPVS